MGLDGRFADEELGGDLGVGEAAREQPSTSVSRSVSSASASVDAVAAGSVAAKRSSSRRGDRRARAARRPRATIRIASTSSAGCASLSRNPLAPARIAAWTYSSRSNVVSTRTRAVRAVGDELRGSPRSRRAPASGCPSGRRRARRGARRHRLGAVVGLADDLDVAPRSRIIRKPARTSAWSSADQDTDRVTRLGSSSGTRALTTNPRPARGPASKLAAEQRRALTHPDEAVSGRVAVDRRRRAPSSVTSSSSASPRIARSPARLGRRRA